MEKVSTDQREIDKVVKFCRSVDELITCDPNSRHLEVLERLRLKMCDRLNLLDYHGAERIAYNLLLRCSGMDKEASILEESELL